MNIIQAIILGIIQGVTEFLPVSSSGHLVLFQKILGVEAPPLTFEIFVHLGTLIAVFIVFWGDIVELLKKPFQRMTYLLIAGTIPTVLIGILFKDFFKASFSSGRTLGFGFLFTGLVLLYAGKAPSGKKKAEEASFVDAAFVGIMQGIAILPAVSRSGMTISGALFRDFDKAFAAKFSFLLSIPVILGAAVFDIKDLMGAGALSLGVGPIVAGVLASAISGYIAVKFMLELIKKQKLHYFSYYVFVLAILVLVDQFFTHFFF